MNFTLLKVKKYVSNNSNTDDENIKIYISINI